MKKIILASASVDRQELLKRVKIPFEVLIPDIDEEYYKGIYTNPIELVKQLAKAKAINIKQRLNQTNTDALIIAADTIVEINGKIIGKANNKKQASMILRQLINKSHNLITGIAVTQVLTPKIICDFEKTIVHFLSINDYEIGLYLETNEWKGRAGAYSINNKAGLFIDSIQGSFSNILGLPLNKLFKILKNDFNLNLLEISPSLF